MLCIILYMYTQSGAGCADANLTIWVSGCPLSFTPGRTFYLMLAGGTANLLAALTVLIMIKFGMASSISTYLEIDYDTPWSSKKIVKEMEERKDAFVRGAQREPRYIWSTLEFQLEYSVNLYRTLLFMRTNTCSQKCLTIVSAYQF